MVGERIVDPQTGREYVVTWDGARGSASLLGEDDYRYRRQQPDVKGRMTRDAIGPLGFRPTDVKCNVPVDWEW